MENRKYEKDALRLQQAAGNNSLNPIWKYHKMPQRKRMGKNYMLNKQDGAITKTIEDRQERWIEWIQTCFQTTPEQEIPEISYITEKSEKN